MTAEFPSRLEPLGLSRKDGKRPDGMRFYKEGKSQVWDFTCVNTLPSTYLKETSVRPGAAAEKAEKTKLKKYEANTTYFLLLLAFEALGIAFKRNALRH